MTTFYHIISEAPVFEIRNFEPLNGFELCATFDYDRVSINVSLPSFTVSRTRMCVVTRERFDDCILTQPDKEALRSFLNTIGAYMETVLTPYPRVIRVLRRYLPTAPLPSPAHRYDWPAIVAAAPLGGTGSFQCLTTSVTEAGPTIHVVYPVHIGTRLMACSIQTTLNTADPEAMNFHVSCESMTVSMVNETYGRVVETFWLRYLRTHCQRTISGVLKKDVVLRVPGFDMEVKHRAKPTSYTVRYKGETVNALPGWSALATALIDGI